MALGFSRRQLRGKDDGRLVGDFGDDSRCKRSSKMGFVYEG